MFARERLAEKIGLPEARIQVSRDFILFYAIVPENEGPLQISLRLAITVCCDAAAVKRAGAKYVFCALGLYFYFE